MNSGELIKLAHQFLVLSKYSKSMLAVASEVIQELSKQETAPPEAAKSPKVLVVEDDEDTLAMLKLMLQSRGYEVFTAQDVDSAINIAFEHDDIQSLVTDFHIKNKTAHELLSRLGDRKPKNVVLLSGKHFDGDPTKEVPGINKHLSKPFRTNKLFESVDVKDLPNE